MTRAKRHPGIQVAPEVIHAVARPVGYSQDGDLCGVHGCFLQRRKMNLCRSHYSRWWRWRVENNIEPPATDNRNLLAVVKPATWTSPKLSEYQCSVEGCDAKFQARGLCGRHYHQWRRLKQAA